MTDSGSLLLIVLVIGRVTSEWEIASFDQIASWWDGIKSAVTRGWSIRVRPNRRQTRNQLLISTKWACPLIDSQFLVRSEARSDTVSIWKRTPCRATPRRRLDRATQYLSLSLMKVSRNTLLCCWFKQHKCHDSIPKKKWNQQQIRNHLLLPPGVTQKPTSAGSTF